MDEERRGRALRHLQATADRLDALADSADLMGDPDGAEWLRAQASRRRLEAMSLLDD